MNLIDTLRPHAPTSSILNYNTQGMTSMYTIMELRPYKMSADQICLYGMFEYNVCYPRIKTYSTLVYPF